MCLRKPLKACTSLPMVLFLNFLTQLSQQTRQGFTFWKKVKVGAESLLAASSSLVRWEWHSGALSRVLWGSKNGCYMCGARQEIFCLGGNSKLIHFGLTVVKDLLRPVYWVLAWPSSRAHSRRGKGTLTTEVCHLSLYWHQCADILGMVLDRSVRNTRVWTVRNKSLSPEFIRTTESFRVRL